VIKSDGIIYTKIDQLLFLQTLYVFGNNNIAEISI